MVCERESNKWICANLFLLLVCDTMLANFKLGINDFFKQILVSRSMVSAIGLHRYKMSSSKAMLAHR